MGYDGRVVFEIDADTKHFDNQIENVKEELNELLLRYDETKAMKPFKGKEEDLRYLGIQIEKANNKLVSLQNQEERVMQQQQKLQQENQKTGVSFDKAFSKGLKTAKKLVLGIVGIRSAYMLARKASSAYMAEDTELAQKMQSAWVGLGAFLEPFLTWVSEIMLKLVGYLNVFIKALTGVDYIANANAKSIAKQTKEQEKLNKAVKEYQNYDFDVIRTQQSDSGGFGASDSGTSSLIELPELNDKIVKKLQDLAKWLKDNKDLIEDIGIALGITFGAIAIGKLLTNIATLIGSAVGFTGLAGLLAILSLLAIVWTITLIVNGLDDLKEAWDIYNRLVEEGVIQPQEKRKEQIKSGNTPQSTAEYEQSIGSYEIYKKGMQTYSKFDNLGNWLVGGNKQGYKNSAKALMNYISILIEYGKQNQLTTDGYKDLLKFETEYGDYFEELQALTGDYTFSMKDVYSVTRKYGQELADTTGVASTSIKWFNKEKTAVEETTTAFEDGEQGVENYFYSLNKIPSNVSTDVELDNKDANTKVASYKSNLLQLPSIVTTKIQATLDTTLAEQEMMSLIQKMNVTGMVTSVFNTIGKFIRGYAGGGYISQPTFAMIGEGKYNEYVIPEGEDYISRLANEIGKYGSGGGVTNVYLDGRLIQRQVNKKASQVSFTRNGR